MRCLTCHGKKFTSEFIRDELGAVIMFLPCEDCGGSGIVNCCEGLQANEKPNDENDEQLDGCRLS